MAWDPVWEQIFRARDWTRYPSEDVVRFMAAHYLRSPNRSDVRVLDLGCGTGGNAWFLAREGFETHGIDASPMAIEKAKRRLSEDGLTATFSTGYLGEFEQHYQESSFDVVIVAGVLHCNPSKAGEQILAQAFTLLKPAGRVFTTMISTGTTGEGIGTQIEPGTFIDVREGALQECGLVHFFTADEVVRLFARFEDVSIGYFTRGLPNGETYKHWVVEGRKPQR
jgi:2-polyprenyl-3-methyl-5-hydroxy-6-metoxy-1,4-benzoquinol methylase